MIYNILFDSSLTPIIKIILLCAFVFSVMLAISSHEFAHGYAAYKQGDSTAKHSGRLTLNPLVHFDLFGLLMFAAVGFGWAKPVPVNPYNFRDIKKGMLITSIAGVIANLIYAFIAFWLMVAFGYLMSRLTQVGIIYYIIIFFYYFSFFMCVINISLMAFNLLPIYPLDGFRVVECLTKPNNPYVLFMRKYGVWIFIGILLLGSFFRSINFPEGDIFGQYIGWIQGVILKWYNSIMGAVL